MIYENSSHEHRRYRIEMHSVFDIDAGLSKQAQISLINQISSLKRVATLLSPHPACRNAAQLRIDQLKEPFFGVLIARTHKLQECGYPL